MYGQNHSMIVNIRVRKNDSVLCVVFGISGISEWYRNDTHFNIEYTGKNWDIKQMQRVNGIGPVSGLIGIQSERILCGN